jgi:hypothetical protein
MFLTFQILHEMRGHRSRRDRCITTISMGSQFNLDVCGLTRTVKLSRSL